MSLSRNEIVHLLALVAALDGVDTDDRLTVSAWHDMSKQGQWESFDAAKRALLVYRTKQPDYPLRPGHITGVLERVRREAMVGFDPSSHRIPDDAAQDPAVYQAWVRALVAQRKAAAIAAFAAGDDGPRGIEGAA